MRKLIFILGFVMVLFSCKQDKDSGILSTEKMEAILWDMMRADEMVNYQFSIDTSLNRNKKASELYNQIFSIHKISKQEFDRNFKYYQSRPDLLKTIFDSLSSKSPTLTPAFEPKIKKAL